MIIQNYTKYREDLDETPLSRTIPCDKTNARAAFADLVDWAMLVSYIVTEEHIMLIDDNNVVLRDWCLINDTAGRMITYFAEKGWE